MTAWNYAEVWEAVAAALPDAPAVTHGATTVTWRQFDRRADGLARWLLDGDVTHQDTVALYLANSNEYPETEFACFKAGLVPVNTNYRYTGEELVSLWADAGAKVVVFHGRFADRIEALDPRPAPVDRWLWVDDGSGACPSWATPYEEAAAGPPADAARPVRGPWGVSPDDLLLLYTGGTTGMPKGVMWRQDDLFVLMNSGGTGRYDSDGGLDGLRDVLVTGGPGGTLVPACPQMHGTGGFSTLKLLSEGGRVVTLTSPQFDPVELLDTVERERANVTVIVGDAFARPIVRALDASPGRWDLSSLVAIMSSGVMWSEETKQALLRHHPGMVLIDAFSSSEALGMGASLSSAAAATPTARFTLGPQVRVIDEDGRDIVPGSGRSGVLALGGRLPLGYYGDPVKTAATFRTIDGVRYSIPGDHAEITADGIIHLLGRGSVCINTGGEKVFPEEVEEILKQSPSVADAVVVGVPDDRFGERVVAVVEPAPGVGAEDLDRAALIVLVRDHLADYKVPRHVRVVESIGRSPAGKVDYARHRTEAADEVAVDGGHRPASAVAAGQTTSDA